MQSTSTTRAVAVLTLIVCGIGAWPCLATPVWFGGPAPASFTDMTASYAQFMGQVVTASYSTITFDDLAAGDDLADQYAASMGVSFLNTSVGSSASLSGIHAEGGSVVDNLTGYDGSYMPDGNQVVLKSDNDDAATPFTIVFDDPVSSVGAFFGVGTQGNTHSLTISIFDDADVLLGEQSFDAHLWDHNPSKQNYEGFFGVQSPSAEISRVEIRNDSSKGNASTLILDNIEFANSNLPEPITAMLLISGGAVVLYRWQA